MKYILIILLFIAQFAQGQNLRKWSSDSTTNTLWGDWFYRAHPTYSWSADALKLADYRLVKDSSLFDMYRIPGIDSIYFVRGGTVFAIKDSAGSAGTTYTFQHSLTESGGTVNLVNDEASPGNLEYYGTNSGGTKGYFPLSTTAFLNGGNSFGATATIGTNDNFGLEVELNNIVKHRFHPDGTLSLNLTSDVTQILYVNGASRFNGVLNIENNFGLSALSGAAMANFGANGPTTSVTWALNNNYINANTTKNYFRIAADAESNTSTTQTINQLLINPTYNNTSGTSTMRGIYYNPTLTAVTGTTNIAFENTSGFIRLRTLPTGYGAYTILVHNPDSNVAQVPASTFATQSALNDTAAAIRAAGGGGDGPPNFILQFSNTQAVTVSNTATETTIYGTGEGSAGIDGTANITAGTRIVLKGSGTIDTDAAVDNDVQFDFDIGSTTLGINITDLATGLNNSYYEYEYVLIPVATGTNQDAIYQFSLYIDNNGTPIQIKSTGRFPTSFTTTGTVTCDVTVDWVTADTENNVESNFNTVELFKK